MSYLRALETDNLTLPSDNQYTVQMKACASYGDELAAQAAMLRIADAVSGVTEMEWAAYIRCLLARLIVSWNLTDTEGQTLPINERSIELLDRTDGAFLAAEAQKRLGARPPETELPFVSSSSPPPITAN